MVCNRIAVTCWALRHASERSPDSLLSHRDAPQLSRKPAFFEFGAIDDVEPGGEPINERLVEKVHDEPSAFEHPPTMRDPGAMMSDLWALLALAASGSCDEEALVTFLESRGSPSNADAAAASALVLAADSKRLKAVMTGSYVERCVVEKILEEPEDTSWL